MLQIGKTVSAGTFQASYRFPAWSNIFNMSTCTGYFVTTAGRIYHYTSAASGNSITLIDGTNDDIVAVYTIRLDKV